MACSAHLLFWKADVNDDTQIIQRVLAGERSAFGLLVTRYQDRLYNTLFHVVGSAEDARDLVQEAFVQALVKLDTFRGTSAFYTWLYRIAFNQAMSLKRREKPVESIDPSMTISGLGLIAIFSKLFINKFAATGPILLPIATPLV